MKEVKGYNPIIAPYGNVPWLSFQIEVSEKTKYVFYAKKNELIIQESKTVINLFPGINLVTVPMNVSVSAGDYLAVCGSEFTTNSEEVK